MLYRSEAVKAALARVRGARPTLTEQREEQQRKEEQQQHEADAKRKAAKQRRSRASHVMKRLQSSQTSHEIEKSPVETKKGHAARRVIRRAPADVRTAFPSGPGSRRIPFSVSGQW